MEKAPLYKALEEQFSDTETLEFSGGDVEVYDVSPEKTKTETPAIFFPGWALSAEAYKENIIGIAEKGRRVVSFDAPHGIDVEEAELASGYPEAELRKVFTLIQTIEERGLSEVDIVGHSEGCLVAVIAATLYPEKFRNLVLVNPAGMMGEDKASSLTSRFAHDNLRRFVKGMGDFKKSGRSLKALGKTLKSALGSPIKTFREILAIADSDIRDILEDLKDAGKGIAVVHSVDDKAFPMERLQRNVKKKHVTGLYSITGAHNEIYLDPEVRAKLIDQALDALEAKGKKETENEAE
jgi:pimeloyl-ACP methyl ester carboxylesterase